MLRSRKIVLHACALLAFCALASVVSAEPVVVTTTSGQTVTGELVTWTSARVEISVNGSLRSFAPAELLNVRREQAAASDSKFAPLVELADESQLPISDFAVKGRVASITTPISQEALEVPADRVRLVKWVDAEVGLPLPDATGDCVAVLKKDSSDTEILTGVIGDVTTEQVEFTWEGETLPVRRTKIAALSFFQKEGSSSSSDPRCFLTLASGARLAAKELVLKGDTLEVSTVTGLTLRVPLSDFRDADYSAGKLSYLSDMRPLRAKWTALIELPAAAELIQDFGAPRMNIAFTGSPLTLSWPTKDGTTSRLETYNKGLALRSRTELEYRLPRGMRRLVAIAGIDPETLTQGDVLLRIEADGETLFEETITGKNPPREIDANIEGKQKLRIFVDYGGNLDLGDRLHLVEARLVK